MIGEACTTKISRRRPRHNPGIIFGNFKQWRLFKLETPRVYLIGKAPQGVGSSDAASNAMKRLQRSKPKEIHVGGKKKKAKKGKKGKKAKRKAKRNARKKKKAKAKAKRLTRKKRIAACKKKCGRANPITKKGRKAMKCRRKCK